MLKFLRYSLLYAIGLATIMTTVIAFRILYCGSVVAKSRHLEPWQSILFIGDSHIGCTFVEDRAYANRVIWESSMPQQFTLMRLMDMERDSTLKSVDTLVLDIGFQSFGQQRRERMKELCWRMLPISWRHADLLPISTWDRLSYAALHYNDRFAVASEMPTANTSVLTRTQDERDKEFAITAETHFGWLDTPDAMCNDWEHSLSEAIAQIAKVCERNRVKLIFISAPLSSYYRSSVPPEAERELQKFVVQIKTLDIAYYDLRSWGEDAFFRDSFHLTLDGAKNFTKWFYAEILKRKIEGCV